MDDVAHGALARSSRRGARIAAMVGAASVLAASLALVGFARPASADQPPTPFAGFAEADGVLTAISNPSFPLGLVLQGPGPDATSSADSLGTADAQASYPYLGQSVQGLPGLASGLFGVPVPAYPFEASTSAGQPADDVPMAGFTLHAASPDAGPEAKATVGQEASGVVVTSSVTTHADGTITAQSESTITGADVAGLVTVRGVQTRAEASFDPATGKVTRSSSLSIGRISAPGLTITVPASTPAQVPVPIPIPGVPQIPPINLPSIPLPFAGQTIVSPDIGYEDGSFTLKLPAVGQQSYAVPVEAVTSAFGALGVHIKVEEAVMSTTGITSQSLVITTDIPSPSSQYLDGNTTVATTLGTSTVSMDAHPAPQAPAVNLAPVPTATVPPSTEPSEPHAPTSATPAVPAGIVLPPPSVGGVALPASAVPPPTVASDIAPQSASAFYIADRLRLLYPVLVAVGGLAFAAGHFVRLKGVRSEWGS